MAKININDPKQLETLRQLLKEDEVFPFAGFSTNDTNVKISIKISRLLDGDHYPTETPEYDEAIFGLLPDDIRKAIFKHLAKMNPNPEVTSKLKELGVDIVFAPIKHSFWSKE